ncbi:MAG TPA: class I SAM-dependent methyltransferase, partial [Planctomycetota bacterium]|nr:class I SAM-dependent methyltransferase [Planctomycetota bacterium]
GAEVARRCRDVERRHWWYRGRRRVLERILELFLRPDEGRRILDVGSGTGLFHRTLHRFGTVRGIEKDPDFAGQARSDGLDVEVMDFPRETPAGPFHVVTLFDVLEHQEDDHDCLLRLRHLLAPGGLLFLSVPAIPWLYSDYDAASGHYRRYDAALLRRRLRDAGFDLLKSTHFNTVLLPLAVLWRLRRLRPSGRPDAAAMVDRCGGMHEGDLQIPAAPVNELFACVFSAESAWAAGPGLPTGLSLAAVARRTGV